MPVMHPVELTSRGRVSTRRFRTSSPMVLLLLTFLLGCGGATRGIVRVNDQLKRKPIRESDVKVTLAVHAPGELGGTHFGDIPGWFQGCYAPKGLEHRATLALMPGKTLESEPRTAPAPLANSEADRGKKNLGRIYVTYTKFNPRLDLLAIVWTRAAVDGLPGGGLNPILERRTEPRTSSVAWPKTTHWAGCSTMPPRKGTFVRIVLADGSFAYGRLLEPPYAAFYQYRTVSPDSDLDGIASKPVLFKTAVRHLALDSWETFAAAPSSTPRARSGPPSPKSASVSSGRRSGSKIPSRSACSTPSWAGPMPTRSV